MAIQEGTRLGAFEILTPLDAGGMGEVYRARDTKLGRDVALKILPEAMARDAERMARFEREARTLASLNHPNIAAVYGLEEPNGVRALVMELVEGETLAERISVAPARAGLKAGATTGERRSPMTTDDALPIAKQIAEGLEYAHERGVIHRDLKPANVKITREGKVKILDFGLAKVLDAQDSSVTMGPANSPALSTMATRAGMIPGTAAYMSPEQAKRQRVDKRTDIWSFGCVLYEMLAGRKAFEGKTISHMLAAVIKSEPDWTALPETTPPSVQTLVRRCLTKDPMQRLRDIGEARIAIEETLSGDAGTTLVPALAETTPAKPQEPALSAAKGSSLRRILPWAAAGIVVCLAAFAGWRFETRNRNVAPAPQRAPVLSHIPPPLNTTFRDFGFGAGPVVVSPDGRQLAFSATDQKGVTKLWVRPLGPKEPKAIPGTEDAASPFWSPDGSSLGYFADGELKTVNLANGNIQVLADAPCNGSGGAWSPGGTILFAPLCEGPLESIPSSGGKPSPATRLESGEMGHMSPAFLPDGQHFLYVSGLPWFGSHSIWMGSLGSSEQELVLKDASSPGFASGHLLFTRDNRVFAQPFDPATGKLAGEATALAKGQSYSVSSGALAFQRGTLDGRLQWYDRSGNQLGSVGPVAIYASV
ncbi:MAG: protein kinase, partial [Acidobacteriota bacterium]